jgi:TetR/AcrR family transcriptional repressor of nem operon
MRYPPTHKLDTRRRIVAAASAAFRERGVENTGVDEVMRRAGLTHGGFYAHFEDKAALVAEPTAGQRARLLIDSYLSARHRDNRGSGCLVVAVGADMARLDGAGRAGYARGFARHLDRLCAALRLARDEEKNRDRVTHLMSSLVGALLFARAADTPERSDALLSSARRMLREEFR